MNPMLITRSVAGVVVSSGVLKIVKDVVANNVTTDNKLQTLIVKAGTYGIGSAVSAVVVAHVDKKFIRGIALVNKIKERAQEPSKES